MRLSLTSYDQFHIFIFLAVKFGRMSKKQREKVEDEVRYHKEINSQGSGGGGNVLNINNQTGSGTSPDSSVFDPPQPSSTEHIYGNAGYVNWSTSCQNYIRNIFIIDLILPYLTTNFFHIYVSGFITTLLLRLMIPVIIHSQIYQQQ